MSAFSSGEILWRIKKINLKNHFLPLAKTSSRGSPSAPSYESYTRKKRKMTPWMNVNEKMVMVVDNKKYCLIGRLEWTVKKEKVRKISYVSLKRVLLFFYVFFLCTIQRREIKIDSLMASPLVLNFGTTRMVAWSFIIGWAPPPGED